MSLGKEMIMAAIPEGAAWFPVIGGDLDKTYDALGEIFDNIVESMLRARYVRDPLNTGNLEDLEREYGILTNTLIVESLRRQQLFEKKNKTRSTAAADYLESLLQGSGFDVQVHRNDPEVDPDIFLNQNFQMVAGQTWAIAGHEDAYAGRVGGEILVNGEEFTYFVAYDSQAGNMYAGNSTAVAGYFTSLGKDEIIYQSPTDPDVWPFVFFVGGDAVRNGAGELTSIEQAQVPTERKDEFKNIILSVKPLFTWAGLIVVFN
jgi:hypothetical protein